MRRWRSCSRENPGALASSPSGTGGGSPRPNSNWASIHRGHRACLETVRGEFRDGRRPAADFARSHMRVFLTVTNQPGSAFRLPKFDARSEAFQAGAQAGWDGGPLQILVTRPLGLRGGDFLSMRHDIVVTLRGSIISSAEFSTPGSAAGCRSLGWASRFFLCCSGRARHGLLIFHELNW